MRAVKGVLNLETQSHRVLWALWLTQWQGVLRAGDLIRVRGEEGRAWLPERDTHRARVAVTVARNALGQAIGAGLKLTLKPTKTDRAGE